MATLHDFVSDNKIEALRTRTTSRPGPLTIVFSDNGSDRDRGVKLQDATYSYERYFDKWRNDTNGYKGKYTCSYTKNAETDDDLYPIIALAISIDATSPLTYGMITDNASTFQYDQTDSYLLTGIGYDGHITYECTDGSKFGGGADRNSIWWKQTTENHTTYYDGDGYEVRGTNFMGYDTMASPQYFNHNGTNWGREVAIAHYSDDNGDGREPLTVEVDTNIPVIVFRTEFLSGATISAMRNKLIQYNTSGDLSIFDSEISNGNAVLANVYREPSVTEGTLSYYCYSDVYSGKWEYDGVSDEEFYAYKYLRVWVAPTSAQTVPRVTLIKDREGQHLKARIKVYGEVKQVQYSEDGGRNWYASDTIPYTHLYYKRTEELSPYDPSNPGERLPLFYDKNHGGNILFFASEEDSDAGDTYALDYSDKLFYKGTNETGTEEDATTMSLTSLNSFFMQYYVVDKADMATISDMIYDSSTEGLIHETLESVKRSLEFHGQDPIDNIGSLTYYPFDLTTILSSLGTAGAIRFGDVEIPGVDAYKVINFNSVKEVGSINILPSYDLDDYRNYRNVEMYIYLPFVGLQKLQYTKYLNKTLTVRYYLDITSGKTLACLFANNVLYDYFNGSCGVEIPITGTRFSEYANANIQNSGRLLQSMNPTSTVDNVMGNMSKGQLPTLSVAKATVGRVIEVEKAMYQIATTSVNQFSTTKGGSTPLLNNFLPNYCYCIFSILDSYMPTNLETLAGRRSSASGTIGSFSGFLSVEDVKLECSATDTEKTEILSLLASGIYI